MISILSPAKSLDFETKITSPESEIRFPKDSLQLVKTLRNKPVKFIKELMSVSQNIAQVNSQRYKNYSESPEEFASKQAIYAFKGDVYIGMDPSVFNKEDLEFSQKHVRILSGLYGLLRPLDKIQAYRLEMGTKLGTRRGKNLYQFWGDKITKLLKQDLEANGDKVLINLASQEYFKSIDTKKLKANIIDISFREFKDGEYKFISFNAKKARGLMTRYIVKNKLSDPEGLLGFDYEEYVYNPDFSSPNNLFFTREFKSVANR